MDDRFWPVALCHRLIIDLKRGGFSLDPRPVWHWNSLYFCPSQHCFHSHQIKYGVSSPRALNTLVHLMKRAVPPPNEPRKEYRSLKASDYFSWPCHKITTPPQNTLHPTSSRAALSPSSRSLSSSALCTRTDTALSEQPALLLVYIRHIQNSLCYLYAIFWKTT